MKLKIFLSALSILLYFTNTSAQISHGGKPLSFAYKSLKSVSVFNTPLYNYQQMIKEDEENKGNAKPFRYGKVHNVVLSPENSGKWQELPTGEKIWQLKIQSKGAFAIGLIFNKFKLKNGVQLFIYSDDKKRIIGSFTKSNNKANGWFSTVPIAGENIVVELNVAKDVDYGQMQLSGIVHDYKNAFGLKTGYGSSGSCNINVNCPEGADWQDEKRSVVKYTWNGWLCTGALINNTNEDGKPYLLTANHCINTMSEANNAVFWFNYESDDCVATGNPSYQSISSANLVATPANDTLDFSLLELSIEPPSNYNVYYAGWNRSAIAASNTVSIHHPQGDIKKISLDYDPPITGNYGVGYLTNSHWRILVWDVGTTEPGSSGSPLFDENHRIVGDLTGGTAACGNSIDDYYAKFNLSWDFLSEPNQQLKAWLDPNNTGIMFLDGMGPNVPKKDTDAKIEKINDPNGEYCSENVVTPSISLINKGINDLTSVNIHYQVNGGVVIDTLWEGFLITNASETVLLKPTLLTAGKGSFKVYTTEPNGIEDERKVNDTLISNYDGQSVNEGFIINGDQEICANLDSANYFTTELGTYNWNVFGGAIILGDSTENIKVKWDEWGQREVGLGVTNLCGEYNSETLIVNPSELSLLLQIASSDQQTTWLMIDDMGDTVLQGIVEASSEVTKIPICLNTNNYTFIIFSDSECSTCYYQLINSNAKIVVLGGSYSAVNEPIVFNLQANEDYIRINLYPNPSSDFVNIESSYSGIYENAVYSIYNLSGRLIVPETKLNSQTIINISELRNGYYIFKINSDYGKFSQKFLKP